MAAHSFHPNGDVLVDASAVVRYRRGLFGLRVRRTVWRLNRDHVYQGPTFHLKAPAGYEFDGATVPRPLWFVFERFGLWIRGALYHDLLYDLRLGTKAAADAAFLEIMRHDGVNAAAAFSMFFAVLLWPPNWRHWAKPTEKNGTGVKLAK